MLALLRTSAHLSTIDWQSAYIAFVRNSSFSIAFAGSSWAIAVAESAVAVLSTFFAGLGVVDLLEEPNGFAVWAGVRGFEVDIVAVTKVNERFRT